MKRIGIADTTFARFDMAEAAADEHLEAALPHVAEDYAGEHWLASFALLALLSSETVDSRA